MGKKLHWKLKSSRKKNREMRVSTEGGIYLKKDEFDKEHFKEEVRDPVP